MKIKLSRKNKIVIGLCLLSGLTISTFQNCSKPTLKITESTSTVGATGVVDVPVNPENPPPANTRRYEKSFSVNQSSSKVDVLVVIDNSGSMNFEQKNMANRFDKFLDKLQGLDWQVGIVTTDVSTDANLKDGRLVKFDALNKYIISSQDDLAIAKSNFASAIQRPESEGSGAEQGIKATYRALERSLMTQNSTSNPNSSLLREGAALSVIVVTDADESAATEKNMPQNLFDYVKLNFSNKVFKFNSIIVKPNDLDCKNDRSTYMNSAGQSAANSNETYGLKYKELTDMTSGVIGTVCAQDYGDQLSVIGQNTSDQVNEILLDCRPIDINSDGQVDVAISTSMAGVSIPNYRVVGEKVIFNSLLAAGDYKINYSCSVITQ